MLCPDIRYSIGKPSVFTVSDRISISVFDFCQVGIRYLASTEAGYSDHLRGIWSMERKGKMYLTQRIRFINLGAPPSRKTEDGVNLEIFLFMPSWNILHIRNFATNRGQLCCWFIRFSLGGLELLMEMPRPSIAATGSSLCTYFLAYHSDTMEKICGLPTLTLERLVK